MSRSLIIVGVVLILIGLLWPAISKLGLGRLPGDIVIERENFRLYIPLTTVDHCQRGSECPPVAAEPVIGCGSRF